MKIVLKNPTIWLLICLSMISIASCTKGELVEQTEYVVPSGSDIKLKFFLAAPEAPNVNFFINNIKVSAVNNSLGIENGYGYGGLYPDLGYLVVNPANQYDLQIKVAGSATEDAGLAVYEGQLDIQSGKSYSFFTSSYDKETKRIDKTLLIEDIRPSTDTSKTYVRFMNLLNDIDEVTLIQSNTEKIIASSIPSGAVSEFVEIDNPGQSNPYQVLNTADNSVLASTTGYTLSKGRSYTIGIYGKFGDSTFPPTLSYYTTFY